jgi:hypothetical protein
MTTLSSEAIPTIQFQFDYDTEKGEKGEMSDGNVDKQHQH